MIDVLSAVLLGVLSGAFTGLFPGIHVNLIAAVALSQHYTLNFRLDLLLTFLVSMGITHTFVNAIPSILLGVPDAALSLAVLPGHRLFQKGLAYEAVRMTIFGSFFSVLVCVILFPLLLKFIPAFFYFVSPFLSWILLLIVVFLLFREGTSVSTLLAFIVFLFSGFLGLVTFDMSSDVLLPLLSGLFGASTIFLSFRSRNFVRKQAITQFSLVSPSRTASSVFCAIASSCLITVFPGLGPAQASSLSRVLAPRLNDYTYLIIIGGISTSDFFVSIITFFTIHRARNGVIATVASLITSITLNQVIFFICIILIASSIAAIVTLFLGRGFIKFFGRINYFYLNLAVLTFLFFVVFIFSSWVGLLIFVTATFIGILPQLFGVHKSHAMGCLLLPVIINGLF